MRFVLYQQLVHRDTITTCVMVIDDVLGMTLANAVVTCNGETLATTEIKIAVREAE